MKIGPEMGKDGSADCDSRTGVPRPYGKTRSDTAHRVDTW